MGFSTITNNRATMRGASLAESSALVAVLEQKSFTKAAKLLGLSTPRVSDMVRGLEERLGVRLVERTTRSVAQKSVGVIQAHSAHSKQLLLPPS